MERIPEDGAMVSQEEVESYDRLSKKYLGIVEKNFVRRLKKLLKRTGRGNGSLILDIGTGTCNIPVRLLSGLPGAYLVAVDLSFGMLEQAGSNISGNALEKRILLVNADSQRLPFKSQAFDLTFSHSTMHHLRNPLHSIEEMVRVTGQGRHFIVRDLRRPAAFLLEWYVRIFGFAYEAMMKEMYRESLQAGFTFKELENISRRIEGAVVRVRNIFITHLEITGRRSKN